MIKLTKNILPVDIVLSPEWWNKHEGITFDRDFFFHPARRVEDEQKMEVALYDRWGEYGLGAHHNEKRAEVGPVHLAAGYMISEMLGCSVEYSEKHPPQVSEAGLEDLNLSVEKAFSSEVFVSFSKLIDELKAKYPILYGDVNFGGILNIAMDLRGQSIFMDMVDKPDEVDPFFNAIYDVITRFTSFVQKVTGSSSISVNRNVRHLSEPVFLHSECSYTMISTKDYERYLFPFDRAWALAQGSFGIHYCGEDAHRYAESFAKLPKLDFLDVGWGGDLKFLRKHLPDTFLNIRLSPVKLVNQSPGEIKKSIEQLVSDSRDINKTGVCCINKDMNVPDENITAIFETVNELRKSV